MNDIFKTRGSVLKEGDRTGFIARLDGEQLIDFIKRIVFKDYTTFKQVNKSKDELIPKLEFITKETVDDYKGKITRSELVDPVLVDEDTKEIINGNHRAKAYKDLDRAQVPVILCGRKKGELNVKEK